jgi:hypothetical protein
MRFAMPDSGDGIRAWGGIIDLVNQASQIWSLESLSQIPYLVSRIPYLASGTENLVTFANFYGKNFIWISCISKKVL